MIDPERVLFGPLDFAIDDQNALQPDVVALAEAPPKGATEISTSLLVFEVLSPSTVARDRNVKADLYLASGVREVWLVDPCLYFVSIKSLAYHG